MAKKGATRGMRGQTMRLSTVALVLVMLASLTITADARSPRPSRTTAKSIAFPTRTGYAQLVLEARQHHVKRADDHDNDGKSKDDDKNSAQQPPKAQDNQNKDDQNKDDQNKDDQNKDDQNKDDKNKDDQNKDDQNRNDQNKDVQNKDDKDKDDQNKNAQDQDKEKSDDKQSSATQTKPEETKTTEANKPTTTTDDKTTTQASKTSDKPTTTKEPTKTTETKEHTTTTESKEPTTTTESKESTKTTETKEPTTTTDNPTSSHKPHVTAITETNGDVTTIDLPTLYPGGITELPTAQVPPTSDAPYRQVSKYPEGLIFIVVGSVIGFAFLCVMAWRSLVAWSVNRSVRQTESSFATGGNNFFPLAAMAGRSKDESSISWRETEPVTGEKKPGKKVRRSGRRSTSPSIATSGGYTDATMGMRQPLVGNRVSGFSPSPAAPGHSQNASTSLFYSPTANAGVGINSNFGTVPRNYRSSYARSASYLPSGYYARDPSSKHSSQQGFSHYEDSPSRASSPSQQRLPLSAQHLHSLDAQQQQQQQEQQHDLMPPSSLQVPYSSSPSLLPVAPPRAPSALLDDLLGTGVSIAGSGPESRGYTVEHKQQNNGGRGKRGRGTSGKK
ncbi:hypothetical protein KEM55_003215 [Ascosphaera atra]|nr:hypothetical protein KEM55_003215 [Ascosphaera atra]